MAKRVIRNYSFWASIQFFLYWPEIFSFNSEPLVLVLFAVDIQSKLNPFSMRWLFSFQVFFSTSYTFMCFNGKAPLPMGFPRQEYWSGLPFPSLRDLPNPGIKSASPALVDKFFTTEPPGKPSCCIHLFHQTEQTKWTQCYRCTVASSWMAWACATSLHTCPMQEWITDCFHSLACLE